MAACERAGSDGRELIVGLVLGHEFEMRLCEAAFPGIRERGWHHATLTAFVSPIVAGRMLRLNPQQIQHAIGISASARGSLGAVTAGKLTMMKNTVDPLATQSGMLAALLAEKRLYRAGARHRRQRRPGALLRARVEAASADRRAGRIVAYHTMWDEGFSDRSPDAHADFSRAGAG